MNLTLNKKILVSLLTAIAMIVTVLIIDTASANAASNETYWLKVNKKANVITAYQKVGSKWKPVRAMLCSTGAPGHNTPAGTFHMGYKSRWLNMIDKDKNSTFEQYTALVQSSGQIYIHSVWYYRRSHSAQSTAEFNKLGQRASHGCIRTSTMDAKWIYDNCNVGTKITIYKSKNPGPLGKPKAIKVKNRGSYWDPTDPSSKNPYFIMPKPVIKVSATKMKYLQYGKDYNFLYKVTARDPNTFMSLTKYVKVKAVYKWSTTRNKYLKVSRLDNKSFGTYSIKYYVKDPYGRSNYTFHKVKVIDTEKPAFTGVGDKTVQYNTETPVTGVTAKQLSIGRTRAMTVTVTAPNGTKSTMTYAQAAAYKLDQLGTYHVTYRVANKYMASRYTVVSANITVVDYSTPTISGTAPGTATAGTAANLVNGVTAAQATADLTSAITVTVADSAGTVIKANMTYAEAQSFTFPAAGTYTVTYNVANKYNSAATAYTNATYTVN